LSESGLASLTSFHRILSPLHFVSRFSGLSYEWGYYSVNSKILLNEVSEANSDSDNRIYFDDDVLQEILFFTIYLEEND
jgi:hypothetical protein